MLQPQRTAPEAHGVFINAANDQIHFGIGRLAALLPEPNCRLREGRRDVGRIGAFSYLGGRSPMLRSIHSARRSGAIVSNLATASADHPTDFPSADSTFPSRCARSPALAAIGSRSAGKLAKSGRDYEAAFPGDGTKIEIANDVWIGEGAIFCRGATIGDGAIIGPRSVATKDAGPCGTVVGASARLAPHRFEPGFVDAPCALPWWDYGFSALNGDNFTDISAALKTIERNTTSAAAQFYQPACALIRTDETIGCEADTGDTPARPAPRQVTGAVPRKGAA